MAAAFLAYGGRYAAGFCTEGLLEVVFVEVWEDFDPCPEIFPGYLVRKSKIELK